jgi:hypothetical protein
MKKFTQRNSQSGIAPLALLLIFGVVILGGGTAAAKVGAKAKNERAAMVAQNDKDKNATSTNGSTATSTATSTPTGKTFNFDLKEQNNSGQSGHVVITEVDGKAKVIVNLTGKPSGVAQPSHIHVSSCATIGAVKYPLTNVTNGASQTMLPVSIDALLTGLPLSLNVHKSASESNVYVACGDIGTSTVRDVLDNVNANVKVDAKLRY